MKRPSYWYDRLELEDGMINRILTAEYVDKNGKSYICDVFKENDQGEIYTQNLYLGVLTGYIVAFPGLPRCKNINSYYYDPSIAQEEGWYRVDKCNAGGSDPATNSDKELVCDLYPNFKYVLKKYEPHTKADLLEKLQMWLVHPELELVLAIGFEKVAMNGSFWRLSEKEMKATCLFMRKNKQFKNLNFREIRKAMKADSPEDYAEFLRLVPSYDRKENPRSGYGCIGYEDYKYLIKVMPKFKTHYDELRKTTQIYANNDFLYKSDVFREMRSTYRDYLTMLYASNHPVDDEYWRYPSDLQAFHDRLVEEERVKKEAEELARAEKEKELIKKTKKLVSKFSADIDGLSIFITTDYEVWKKQAEVLNQCICAAGYYQKMLDGKSFCVFIQKDFMPLATAEITPDGKISQFYADELDRNNCLPSEEIKTAFDKWLAEMPIKKLKPRKQKEVVAA